MMDSSYPQSKSERIRFEGRGEAKAIALLIAQHAKKQICILGRDIDHALFDSPEFIECVSALARRNAHTEIRILVHDTRINVQNNHKLIHLAQQLSSSIHIHNTAKQHRTIQNILLLVDDFGYLTCPKATQYNGTANLYDRLEVRTLQQQFDDMWQQSSPDITVRRLHL